MGFWAGEIAKTKEEWQKFIKHHLSMVVAKMALYCHITCVPALVGCLCVRWLSDSTLLETVLCGSLSWCQIAAVCSRRERQIFRLLAAAFRFHLRKHSGLRNKCICVLNVFPLTVLCCVIAHCPGAESCLAASSCAWTSLCFEMHTPRKQITYYYNWGFFYNVCWIYRLGSCTRAITLKNDDKIGSYTCKARMGDYSKEKLSLLGDKLLNHLLHFNVWNAFKFTDSKGYLFGDIPLLFWLHSRGI